MTSDTAGRLEGCFAVLFPELSPPEIRSSSPASVAAWDSLATVNLIGLIEEEFNVDIPEDALDELGSFALILDYLERHGR